MKECPNCKTIFTDDLFYCLHDGTQLSGVINTIDHTAPTEPAFSLGRSARTEVMPNGGVAAPTAVRPNVRASLPTQEIARPDKPNSSASKSAYVAIAVLVLVCIALGTALVVLNRNRILTILDNDTRSANNIKPPPLPTPDATNSSAAINTVPIPTPKAKPTQVLTASGKWKGEWSTDSGTLLDIEITLADTANSGLDGQIKWTLRKTVRPDKANKIGLSATEFVKGTFDTQAGIIKLTGYRKDDPDGVLVMLDEYKLTVSPDGKSLTGLARNGGKWNGHLKLTRYVV
ncbi:hypothetical protein BH10ACI2_BH10ACI2_21400 [soil metagenome]